MDGLITGLAGVIVWTEADRFEEMRRFYVETLLLRPHSDRARRVNFDWAGVRLTLAVHDGVAGTSQDPLRVMVNLEVEDLESAHRYLIDAGVPCVRSPAEEPWGGRVATYLDPDGNVVQLLELPAANAAPPQ